MMPMAIASGTSARLRRRERAGDVARELDVECGQAARVVRRERGAHLAPTDVEIRVVVGPLGEEPDADDERDRVGERRALERADDLVAGALPSGQRRERGSRAPDRRAAGVGPSPPFNRMPVRAARLVACPWSCPRKHRPKRSSSIAPRG